MRRGVGGAHRLPPPDGRRLGRVRAARRQGPQLRLGPRHDDDQVGLHSDVRNSSIMTSSRQCHDRAMVKGALLCICNPALAFDELNNNHRVPT